MSLFNKNDTGQYVIKDTALFNAITQSETVVFMLDLLVERILLNTGESKEDLKLLFLSTIASYACNVMDNQILFATRLHDGTIINYTILREEYCYCYTYVHVWDLLAYFDLLK